MRLSTTRLFPAIALGATLALACSPAAFAEGEEDELSWEYLFSVSAPALADGCQAVLPGYADNFNRYYPQWREANAQQIYSTREALAAANPDKTIAQIEAIIAGQALDEFSELDFKERQKACTKQINYMASNAP